jgi:hypothetical protein
MPRRPRKKDPGPDAARDAAGTTDEPSEDQGNPEQSPPAGAPGAPEASRRPGLPAPESVVSETEFTSPSGRSYRIIHTNEVDPSDERKRAKGRRRHKTE